jgi:hypothetical protein
MCATHSTKTKKGRQYGYDYYTCSHRNRYGRETCANAFRPRAAALEGLIRKGVFAYIKDPERLRADLEYAIELMRKEERRGDSEREAKMWAGKLAEVGRKRARYQEMAAEGLITLDELRTQLAELGETRDAAQRELAALRDRAERIEELERDAEAILESYVRMTPDALDNLTPEERHRFYRMLGLKVTVGADGSVELDGTFIVDGPLELGAAFEGSEGERALVSTKTGDKRCAVRRARRPTGTGRCPRARRRRARCRRCWDRRGGRP